MSRAQTRFRNDRLRSTNDLITANLALSWNPRNEGGNSVAWPGTSPRITKRVRSSRSIIRFCSFITSARNTMTPRFYLSRTELYVGYTSIYTELFGKEEKRGVFAKGGPCSAVWHCPNIFFVPWLRPPRVYIDYREELGSKTTRARARTRVCVHTRTRAHTRAPQSVAFKRRPATIIRWGFRIASGGLAPIVVTSIQPIKIPRYVYHARASACRAC